MDRGSTKHTGRVDDQLVHEVGALVHGSGHRDELDTAPPGGLAEDDLEQREALARHLRPSAFPGIPPRLAETMEAEHAPAELVDAVRALPGDRAYQNVQELWRDLGGPVEHRL